MSARRKGQRRASSRARIERLAITAAKSARKAARLARRATWADDRDSASLSD